MKICHISDTHGLIDHDTTGADVVVHSGDLMPNRTRGPLAIELPFQQFWLQQHKAHWLEKLSGQPFYYVQGNHDFIDPCPYFRSIGIEAFNLHTEWQELHGITFAGFQYVPWFTGEWNNELRPDRMSMVVDILETDMSKYSPDVLVSHSPVRGICDMNARYINCGSSELYKILARLRRRPRLVLHGHIHESHGYGCEMGIKFSNAATTKHLIEI